MKAGRKASGSRYKRPKKKKLTGRQGQVRAIKLGNKKTKIFRTRGGAKKLISFLNNIVNITAKGKSKNCKIKNVLETPSNIFLARQNILVKGAIIETELGKAKITNRPSQEGIVQAKLLNLD
ncbi:MAG: 30S ribosomal protein S8e [archaeon]